MKEVGHDRVEGDDSVGPGESFRTPEALHAAAQVERGRTREANGDDGTCVVPVSGCEPVHTESLSGDSRLPCTGASFDEDILLTGGRSVPLLRSQRVDRARVSESPGHDSPKSFMSSSMSTSAGPVVTPWSAPSVTGPSPGPASSDVEPEKGGDEGSAYRNSKMFT